MASGIHTMSPQSNMSLITEPLMYNNLPKDEYTLHDFVNYDNSGEFSHYGLSTNTYNYVNGSRSDITKIPLNLTPIPHQNMVNCNNNNKDFEQRGSVKTNNSTNSPQEYESDESTVSYSSRETPDNKETISGRSDPDKEAANNRNKFYHRPCVFQLNLYHPNVHSNKNSRYYFRNGQRDKFTKHSEETERKVHGLMKRFQSRAYKMKIDPNPQTLLNGGPWDLLNQAIWDVFVNKIEKEETYMKKLNLWKTIFLFFRMSLSNYGLYLVGSTMSGFALQGSDIDICLLTKPISSDSRLDSLHHLNYLRQTLLKNGIASEAELITAKVPILKFKSKESGFEIDLNCNNIVGIQNTRLLYCYARLDWRVRPLVVMVKIWAQSNNINDAKNMTISSYSWTLMVIHYLQCGVFPPVLPCLHTLYPEEFSSHENRTMDVQGEVKGLKDFESENTRCLVRTGSRLPIELCKQVRSPKNDPHQWKFLCIEEPFDLCNTARSVFDPEVFKHIKQVISGSYKELACNKTLSHILPIMDQNGQR